MPRTFSVTKEARAVYRIGTADDHRWKEVGQGIECDWLRLTPLHTGDMVTWVYIPVLSSLTILNTVTQNFSSLWERTTPPVSVLSLPPDIPLLLLYRNFFRSHQKVRGKDGQASRISVGRMRAFLPDLENLKTRSNLRETTAALQSSQGQWHITSSTTQQVNAMPRSHFPYLEGEAPHQIHNALNLAFLSLPLKMRSTRRPLSRTIEPPFLCKQTDIQVISLADTL